jgi:serine protease AprX
MASAVSLCLGASAWAGNSILSPELQGSNLPANLDVIIQYKQAPTASDDQFVTGKGGVVKRKFSTIRAGLYTVPSAVLNALTGNTNVAYISTDRTVQASLDQADTTIGANLAASFSVSGAGIGIAVIDSGIANVDDLKGKIVYSQLLNTGATPGDLYGHGTHVAGILAGSGKDSTGSQYLRTFHGVAQGVSLIDLQVLDQDGAGTDSFTIAGIEQAIALASKYNIRVINLSLGRPVFESYTQDPLCQAVEQAWKAGITVVVAAGNYGRANPTTTFGYGTITAPGNDPYVITVGAMNDMGTPILSDDVITTYSSKGPTLFDMIAKPDIVAPGNLIDSLESPKNSLLAAYPQLGIPVDLYTNTTSTAISANYMQLSGTSMSTPFVSAAAALMLQQHPTLTPDQIKARLMKTADKTTFPISSTYTDPTTGIVYHERYDIFTVGAGYLNVGSALANTDVAPTTLSALSPALTFGTNATLSFVAGTNTVWSDHAVWGSNVIWGPNVVWGSNVVWSNGLVPAASDLFLQATEVVLGESSKIAWGSTVIWGSNAETANHAVWGAGVVTSSHAVWGGTVVTADK